MTAPSMQMLPPVPEIPEHTRRINGSSSHVPPPEIKAITTERNAENTVRFLILNPSFARIVNSRVLLTAEEITVANASPPCSSGIIRIRFSTIFQEIAASET